MTVKFRDYYEILGLQRGSSTDEIKSAYRRLARKYHPDLNRSDASAAEHFREVQEAYDVLSDPAKRRRYDSIGAGYQEGMDFQMPNGYDFHRAPKEAEVSSGLGGFSEFFEMLFGGGIRGGVRSSRNGERKRYPNPSSRRGNDVETILPVTLEEIFSGTRKKVRLNVNATCPACQGSGFIGESKCGACEGRGQAPRAKTLDIKIPITAREGARIRLAGQGEAGAGPDAQPGDLFAHVRIQPHPVFKAEGNNIN
ncbi:J domain-containing protein, partial [bacterium]|nr:J domain-containing protein [bacterium]